MNVYDSIVLFCIASSLLLAYVYWWPNIVLYLRSRLNAEADSPEETPEEHTMRVRKANRETISRVNALLSLYPDNEDHFYQQMAGNNVFPIALVTAMNYAVLERRVTKLESMILNKNIPINEISVDGNSLSNKVHMRDEMK